MKRVHAAILLSVLLLSSVLLLRKDAPDPDRPGRKATRDSASAASAEAGTRSASSRAADRKDPLASVAPPITKAAGSSPARFMLRDLGAAAFFTDRGIAFSLASSSKGLGWGVHWGVLGARPVDPSPEGVLETRVSTFSGAESSWTRDQASWSKLRYAEIQPGIDLVLESRPHGVEYSFELAAGADARLLRMHYDGATGIQASADGSSLEITTGAGVLRESGLRCTQVSGGVTREIAAKYVVSGQDQVLIDVGPHDPSLPLLVDPTIGWSSFIGGSQLPDLSFITDEGRAVAVDSTGNVYVTGLTSSPDFPIVGGFDSSVGASDAFVTKINAAGTAIVWSTFLGGSNYEHGLGIGVDASNNVYVTGVTGSDDFPTVNPFGTRGGGDDAFVCKIAASGSSLVWSSYLGGSASEWGFGLAVDSNGSAVVTGRTASANFPVFHALFPTRPGLENAYVAKISTSGVLTWSTYLGGTDTEVGYGIAVDANRNVYVTGQTSSYNYPIVGGFKTTKTDYFDTFVTKFNAAGTAIVYSSYLGGSSLDIGQGIAVDASNNAYVTGFTGSSDFPVVGSGSSPFAGNIDAFVVRINAAGSSMVWSTCLGGTGEDYGRAIAVDGLANVYVTGNTASTDFPATGGFGFTANGYADAFVTKYTKAGARVQSSYLGGAFEDFGFGIAATPQGDVYVVGNTSSYNFPSNNGIDTAQGGRIDVFVTKVASSGTSLTWSTFLGGPSGPSDDFARAVAVDASGNLYIAGETPSADFPVGPGQFNPWRGGTDAFVTKVGPSGVLWTAFLAGSQRDAAWAIAVDTAGNSYVTGYTDSTDFALLQPFDGTSAGGEAFVAKIDGAGALVWSSYLGGSAHDAGRAIAVLGTSTVVVTGMTSSTDFPATGYDTSLGGTRDAFVAKIAAAGPTLTWATFLGGSGEDIGRGIAIDATGAVYVGGETSSTDFPTLNGFALTPRGGSADGFIAKLNSGGATLAWSTYLGGTAEDRIFALTIDASKNVYVSGFTRSTDFPATATFGGLNGQTAFAAKVKPNGTAITWAVQFGGSGDEAGNGIALDASSNVFVTGTTTSADFPTTVSTIQKGTGSDAFVTKIASGGAALLWSSPLGGAGSDEGNAVAVDSQGRAYVAGSTTSSNFPTNGGFDHTLGATWDGFVTRLDKTSLPSVEITIPTSNPSWTTMSTPVLIGGTAADDDGITSVTWSNAQTGGTGTATGKSLWSASVPLTAGANAITVTVKDSNSQTMTDIITVTYTPPLNHSYIAKKSAWSYNDQGYDIGFNWTSPNFPVTDWPVAPGVLGYGETYVNTTIAPTKPVTTYFRKYFYVGDRSKVLSATLKVMYDDGIGVWLNGNVLLSANLPALPVAFSTLATASREAGNAYVTFTVDPALLFNGLNTLAIEVHQASAANNDLVFDAELTGLLNMTADTTAPTAQITSPTSGQVFGGPAMDVWVAATDDTSISKIEVYCDGLLVAVTTGLGPYPNWNLKWDTTTVSNGAHVITAKSYDAYGNVGTSAGVPVTVSN